MLLIFILFFTLCLNAHAQVDAELETLQEELRLLRVKEDSLLKAIEHFSLIKVQNNLTDIGLPKLKSGEELIRHSAFMLVYDEKHEQAKWVSHIISPQIMAGNVSRSNDFREDPKVKTGTAVEADYFLKYLQDDSSYTYDGYGYDRGHLAPSADFRWSEKALSESYYYSNMSPQVADFNRGKWAELESVLRAYIYSHPNTQLYVVTGGVLKDGLPKVERSINKVSIPEQYFKVVIDLVNERGIAFLMPNALLDYPVESYAVSIDDVEELTGIDFYHNLPDALESKLENQRNVKPWMPDKEKNDVEPISPPSLPRNTFNTVQSKLYMDEGEAIKVCGSVVSTKLSRKGNLFLNLDKKFPNQLFSVFIRDTDLLNFSYNPQIELLGTPICVFGKIINLGGTPTMIVENEKAVSFYRED